MLARPTKPRPRQDRGIRIRDRGVQAHDQGETEARRTESEARPKRGARASEARRDRGVCVRDVSPIIQVKSEKQTLK